MEAFDSNSYTTKIKELEELLETISDAAKELPSFLFPSLLKEMREFDLTPDERYFLQYADRPLGQKFTHLPLEIQGKTEFISHKREELRERLKELFETILDNPDIQFALDYSNAISIMKKYGFRDFDHLGLDLSHHPDRLSFAKALTQTKRNRTFSRIVTSLFAPKIPSPKKVLKAASNSSNLVFMQEMLKTDKKENQKIQADCYLTLIDYSKNSFHRAAALTALRCLPADLYTDSSLMIKARYFEAQESGSVEEHRKALRSNLESYSRFSTTFTSNTLGTQIESYARIIRPWWHLGNAKRVSELDIIGLIPPETKLATHLKNIQPDMKIADFIQQLKGFEYGSTEQIEEKVAADTQEEKDQAFRQKASEATKVALAHEPPDDGLCFSDPEAVINVKGSGSVGKGKFPKGSPVFGTGDTIEGKFPDPQGLQGQRRRHPRIGA